MKKLVIAVVLLVAPIASGYFASPEEDPELRKAQTRGWGTLYASAFIPLEAEGALLEPYLGVSLVGQNAFVWGSLSGWIELPSVDRDGAATLVELSGGILFSGLTTTKGAFYGAGIGGYMNSWDRGGAEDYATSFALIGLGGFRVNGFAMQGRLVAFIGSENTTVGLELSIGYTM